MKRSPRVKNKGSVNRGAKQAPWPIASPEPALALFLDLPFDLNWALPGEAWRADDAKSKLSLVVFLLLLWERK
jgi:hypothetical protein